MLQIENTKTCRYYEKSYLVEGAVEELDVAAAAVDVLLVLDGELHDERLLLVGERLVELRAGRVELGREEIV